MKVNPYLAFNGNCEEVINFYKDCFGGEIVSIQRFGDSPMGNEQNKNKVLHSVLKFGEAEIMASDSMDNNIQIGGNVSLSLDFDDIPKMENIFQKVSEGGRITMPLQDTFWGARFGMCTDKYATRWLFNCDKKG